MRLFGLLRLFLASREERKGKKIADRAERRVRFRKRLSDL